MRLFCLPSFLSRDRLFVSWVLTGWLLIGYVGGHSSRVLAEQGGDSSGGGDVIASSTLDVDELNIFWEVYELRPLIAAHLNWLKKYHQVDQERQNEWEMLFGNHDRNIFAVRAGTKKIWVSQESCYFGDGFNHRDGSIRFDSVTGMKSEICLSEPRLKIRYRDNPHKFRRELIALMIHEYSHASGFDEEQADWLQNLSLGLLLHYGIGTENEYPIRHSGIQDISEVFIQVRDAIWFFKKFAPGTLAALDMHCMKLIEAQRAIQSLRFPSGPFEFFEEGPNHPLFGLYESLSIIKFRQCSRISKGGYLPSQLELRDQIPDKKIIVQLDPENLLIVIRHLQNLRGIYGELKGPFGYHSYQLSGESTRGYKARIEREWSLDRLIGN